MTRIDSTRIVLIIIRPVKAGDDIILVQIDPTIGRTTIAHVQAYLNDWHQVKKEAISRFSTSKEQEILLFNS